MVSATRNKTRQIHSIFFCILVKFIGILHTLKTFECLGISSEDSDSNTDEMNIYVQVS